MLFVRGLISTVVVFLLTEPRRFAEGSGCDGYTQTIDLSYTQNGLIYSPEYPSDYKNNEDCNWLIKAPYGERVLIYFTKFDLEDEAQCSFDSVKIFDGQTSYVSLLSKSCGSSLPPPVYSSGRYIYMRFTSDFTTTGKGFVAHYRALSSSSGCPTIVPGASAGVIYSPNFPWNYSMSISCDWLITAPRGKTVNFNFTRFDVKPSLGYENCDDYVEVRNQYYSLLGKYCGSEIPSPITSYGSIRVRFFSGFSSQNYSGFMAFYHLTGDSYPTTAPYPYWTTYPYHWTTYPPVYSPSTQSIYACKPYTQAILFVQSSSSKSIASSPDIDGYYPTSLPRAACTFKIDTTEGYILELSFKKMSISSCSSCSCGYVKVRDGTSSTAQLLGTYCNENYHDVVTTTGKHMFVEYYASGRQDTFKATISSEFPISKKGIKVAAIVVPLVVAVVLFAIIFVVIKCTTIRRSTRPAGPSRVNEVPLHPLPHSVQLPPTTQSLSSNMEVGTSMLQQPQRTNAGFASPETSQPSVPNTEHGPPPYSEPFTTASDPFPPSTDYSQGVTNMSLGDGTAQL